VDTEERRSNRHCLVPDCRQEFPSMMASRQTGNGWARRMLWRGLDPSGSMSRPRRSRIRRRMREGARRFRGRLHVQRWEPRQGHAAIPERNTHNPAPRPGVPARATRQGSGAHVRRSIGPSFCIRKPSHQYRVVSRGQSTRPELLSRVMPRSLGWSRWNGDLQ